MRDRKRLDPTAKGTDSPWEKRRPYLEPKDCAGTGGPQVAQSPNFSPNPKGLKKHQVLPEKERHSDVDCFSETFLVFAGL